MDERRATTNTSLTLYLTNEYKNAVLLKNSFKSKSTTSYYTSTIIFLMRERDQLTTDPKNLGCCGSYNESRDVFYTPLLTQTKAQNLINKFLAP